MSFGLPHAENEERLTYGGYLKVRELTSLQGLLSDPPQHDETLFIIIHQVFELWFKQLLHELDTIVERLDRDETLAAHRLLRRCIEIERVLVSQVAVLETMTPMDFLAFRDHLRPASGFQSSQFREIEAVSGLKDRRYLKSYMPDSDEYMRIQRRLDQPSLGDAFYGLLRRRGFDLPDGPGVGRDGEADGGEADGGEADGGARDVRRERRIRELMRIYQGADQHYDLFLLAESLIEYDEMFTLWRLRHVNMVERMIGGKTGTGGSDGAGYLMKTAERRFFPELWELRNYLGGAGGGCPAEAAGDSQGARGGAKK